MGRKLIFWAFVALPFLCFSQVVSSTSGHGIDSTVVAPSVQSSKVGSFAKHNRPDGVGGGGSGGDTLQLLTLKATPVAEGAGAVAQGARAATTPRLGRVTTNSTTYAAATFVGTYNGVDLYEGSLFSLWNLGDIFIVPRTGGNWTGHSGGGGTGGDRVYLYGDNVTYLGMLGPTDNLIGSTSKLIFGCPLGQSTTERCTGQTENIVLGMKSYLTNPPVGTPSQSGYGRNNAQGFNMNNSYFAYLSFSYGGDQIFDLGGYDLNDGNFPAADYTNGTVSVQYSIFGNGYGTGGIYGQNVKDNIPHGTQGSFDQTKVLYINVSHRFPNYRPAATVNDYDHNWNNMVYNPYIGGDEATVRLMRVNGSGDLWTVNNVYYPGTQTSTYSINSLFKMGDYGGGFTNYDAYTSGNLWVGEYSYAVDNDNWWTDFGSTTAADASDLDGINDTPSNAYYLIDTSTGFSGVRDEIYNYAGPRWATDGSGDRTSNIDGLMQRYLNDINNITETAWNTGIKQDDTSNEYIPATSTGSLYPDINSNLIDDDFETAHSLAASPFAVTTYWDFTDHGGYVVQNTAGYTNIEMYAWWIQDMFWQLLQRGTIGTDTTYTIK